MKPKAAFDATMKRVDRLLTLYELLRNKRRYKTRTDWADKFKALMHWPKNETIHRIDGSNAILVLRGASELTAQEFQHDNLSELLRAALVTSVAALDRYCHEVLISRVMTQVGRSEKNWPKELEKLVVPISAVKKAIAHAKVRKGVGGKKRTRPMNIVWHALQDQFHRNMTLQRPNDIAKAFSMIAVKELWTKCAKAMNTDTKTKCAKAMNTDTKTLERRLNNMVDRRNKIVHEGDLRLFRRAGTPALNPIDASKVRDDIKWLKTLVDAMEQELS